MYFTSDLHLGHKKMLESRPFGSMEEHDDFLISQLKRVNPKSEIWILGDISCGKEDYALGRLSEVEATLHLVSGNHDSVWPLHRNAHKQQRKFLEVFDTVQSMARVHFGGRKVMLNHTPYGSKTPGDRSEGLLHGHTHSEVKITYFNMINVAPEAWDYKLATPAEISTQFDISDLYY